MIYKIVKGRLGNQMFQYASMRAIQLKYFPNDGLKFNFKYVHKKGDSSDGFTNSLTDFNIINDIETDDIKVNFLQKIKILQLFFLLALFKIITNSNKFDYVRSNIETRFKNYLNKSGIFWFTNGYCDFNFKNVKARNKVFYGYFESVKYFKDIKDTLRKEFAPKHDELLKNKELYDVIRNNNSVCVSIRRGDFVSNPIYKEKHYICDESYFYNAIEIIKDKVKKPVFIIFSDDIEWVKKNMDFPKNTYFEDGNDPVWEKMRLMYSCKHFIISNSSFSWWAQFLSKNDDKYVVAPKKWLNNEVNPDIYDDDWILM